MVDGKLAVTVDGERHTIRHGDELLIPRGSVHNVESLDKESSRWLYGFDIAPENGKRESA